MRSDGSLGKDRVGLDIESMDPLKASTVTMKFICFKTPWGGVESLPQKFFFNFKFFTFPAVKTATVQMKAPNDIPQSEGVKPGYPYYLQRITPNN